MRHTEDGLPVTTDADDVVQALNQFGNELLSHGKGAAVVFEAAASDPDCALAQAWAAAAYLFLMTDEGRRKAQPFLDRAIAAAPHANARERMLVAAICAWAADDVPRAIALHGDVLTQWPQDLTSAKLLLIHQLNDGDVRGQLATAESLLRADPTRRFVHGLHAFALEQNDRLREAEFAARTALACDEADPWAEHALAHVFDTERRTEEGLIWADRYGARWDRCSSFLYTHNWWHAALFRIEAGDHDGALALFDRRVWGVRKDYVQDQVNAVALLARLELAGAVVGARWQELADHLERRIGDRSNAFVDLHTLYGLGRAGRDTAAHQLLLGFAARARRDDARCDVWGEVALPAARALLAHARNRKREALDLLTPLLPRLIAVGGSHAQRDWFDRMHRDCLADRTPQPRRRLAA
ncbi:hypothetical protein [Roseiterribacter gracilis]